MPAITATSMTGVGARELTVVTLAGSGDTFTYNPSRKATLILNNVTAGALTPTLDGAGGTTIPVPGIGNVSVASGYTTSSIAAGEVWAIPLDSIHHYLQGTVTISGGTGIEAMLLEF